MTDEMKTLGTHWDGCEEVHPHCKIAKLERELARAEAVIRECRGALMELRARLHAQGRRPEECVEMRIMDEAMRLAAYRENKP